MDLSTIKVKELGLPSITVSLLISMFFIFTDIQCLWYTVIEDLTLSRLPCSEVVMMSSNSAGLWRFNAFSASSRLLNPALLPWLIGDVTALTAGGVTTIPGTRRGTGAGAQVVGTGGSSWTGEDVTTGISKGGPSEGFNVVPWWNKIYYEKWKFLSAYNYTYMYNVLISKELSFHRFIYSVSLQLQLFSDVEKKFVSSTLCTTFVTWNVNMNRCLSSSSEIWHVYNLSLNGIHIHDHQHVVYLRIRNIAL